MADLIFIGIIVAFFGLATLLVAGCDRIIGHDTEIAEVAPAPTDIETAA